MKHLYLIIILILAIVYSMIYTIYETFESGSVDFYVISMKNKQERIDNINAQQAKMPNLKLQVIDAVNGNGMSDQEFKQLYDQKIVSKEKYDYAIETKHGKGVIGCYLSHIKIYDIIKKSSSKYSIIFEDDFQINDDFEKQLNDILDKVEHIDFDFIYLTNLNNNKGQHIRDNIYYMDKKNELWGTQAYLINNSHIDKIIFNTKYIDKPIDNKIADLCKDNIFQIIVINPVIVEHKPPSGTTLQGFVVK